MSKLYIVGIGPGAYEDMTLRAIRALENSDVIIGYTVYIDLVKEHFPDKIYLSTPMMKEVERCEMAISQAESGRTVSMICSGDAGVYGMAGLLFQIGQEREAVDLEVIPGVTAALSGAAVLGAPLIHDFAVISLSDLMTPWELIEGRLRAAAAGDLVVCLYNPSSKKRWDYLKRACRILMESKSPQTVCGYVRNIGRDGQVSQVCSLEQLEDKETDMFTTVFVGNSCTKQIDHHMVTPRGYRNE